MYTTRRMMAGGEMCMDSGGRAARRGGKKASASASASADQHKAAKQPQRGLGVAQLEKMRLHNQMVAAFRSGGLQDAPPPPQMHFAATVATGAGVSSFQPYLTDRFEPAATERRIAGVQQQYYEDLLPYGGASRAAPVYVSSQEARGSGSSGSGQRYHSSSWMAMSSGHDSGGRGGAGAGSSTEELDLELRL